MENKSIVLALGGGGARGLAHIGVLEVLTRENIPVRAVVGPVLAVQAHTKVEQHAAHREQEAPEWEERLKELLDHPLLRMSPQLTAWFKGFRRTRQLSTRKEKDLGISSVMNQALLISEDTLMRLRMQIAPPDLLLKPDVSEIGSLEFYRAKDAITTGCEATETALPAISRLYS